jgi:hypothetical protein
VSQCPCVPPKSRLIQIRAEGEDLGREMKCPTCSTHSNAVCLSVCLSVRTYFSISSEMAGRIGLKFGERTQKVWQSVFHEKKIEKTKFENLRFFFFRFQKKLFFIFFCGRVGFDPPYHSKQLCHPDIAPKNTTFACWEPFFVLNLARLCIP